MLRFEHVSLSYGSQKILDDLSFEIQEGQMAVLIGPSGCGKTTTLKMINRLIEPSAGKIYLNEEDITAKDKVELRRHIGYVIQQIGLFPNMTVEENLAFGHAKHQSEYDGGPEYLRGAHPAEIQQGGM